MAKSEITKILSERLEKLTERKRDIDYKLSDVKQAEQMDIPYQSFLKYKKDKAECPVSALVKMAEYFHVSTDHLLGLQREPTNDPDITAVTEYTGLSTKAAENLHKYKTIADDEYIPAVYISDVGQSYKEALEIINEFIANENMYKLAKLLYELKYDSQTYLEDIDTIKKVYQDDNRSEAEKKSIYSHYEKDIDRINKTIKIDRYEISEFIVHLSDRYDQREQVKYNGNHNPTNK